MNEIEVNNEIIGQYLEGRDDEKYIVAVETTYYQNIASLVISDPIKGKYIKQVRYKPFLWLKYDMSKIMYGGNRTKILAGMNKHSVKITELRTSDKNGVSPERMKNGYRFIAKCDDSYTSLIISLKKVGLTHFLMNIVDIL